MRRKILDRCNYQHQINQPGKGSIRCTGSAHVDNAFLKTDDLADGDHAHSFEGKRFSGANRIYLADHAGKYPARSLYLDSRLDHVFNGCNPCALPGFCDFKTNVGNFVVFKNHASDRFPVKRQHAVTEDRFGSEPDITDPDITHFQFHTHLPFFDYIMVKSFADASAASAIKDSSTS